MFLLDPLFCNNTDLDLDLDLDFRFNLFEHLHNARDLQLEICKH